MVVDSIVFRDEGKASFQNDPHQKGVIYCSYCRSWHVKFKLAMGTEFCAFCSTTHHSQACRAGLGEKCPDTNVDPIHNFLTRECRRKQKFDLNFCSECNCFHSNQGWRICLENNKPKSGWSEKRKLIWKMRWQLTRTGEMESKSLKRERSLFNMTESMRLVPRDYPFASSKFVCRSNTD